LICGNIVIIVAYSIEIVVCFQGQAQQKMDEFLYLIGAVMAVLVLVVIMYMGSVYMMRERSFESAIAAQTANRKELLESASGKQDKKVKRQLVQRKSVEKPLITNHHQLQHCSIVIRHL
jgi:beta-lactamase regulating signal transducer with metallopeptidase domain